MTKSVSFTAMADGTKADYLLLAKYEEKYKQQVAMRVLAFLENLDHSLDGYQVTRLEHSLQTATRAVKDGATEEMVVAALLHDIGDGLASANHSEFAAAVLKPYVSERTYWIVKHHGLFQSYYYAHHFDIDRNQRTRYQDHPYYQDTIDFCQHWDQCSFDPNYKSHTLDYFQPLVKRVFSKEKYQDRPLSICY